MTLIYLEVFCTRPFLKLIAAAFYGNTPPQYGKKPQPLAVPVRHELADELSYPDDGFYNRESS
jgi:hypothetical protein